MVDDIPVCFKCKRSDKKLIMHHVSYNPEKLEYCCLSCHVKLHKHLRKIGKCKIPVDVLRKMSCNSKHVQELHKTEKSKAVHYKYRRRYVYKFVFHTRIDINVMLVDTLECNLNTGNLGWYSYFRIR